jgi:hypothetical protein
MEDGVEISTFSLQAGGHFKKLTPPAFRRTLCPVTKPEQTERRSPNRPGLWFWIKNQTTIII